MTVSTAQNPADLRHTCGRHPGAATEVEAGLWETDHCESCEAEAQEEALQAHMQRLQAPPVRPRRGSGLS